ncbi:MAG: ABC transporter permease [Armatimonadetes bacterium]|nr:ABC transporter permease [Armatimonadota bacterium]
MFLLSDLRELWRFRELLLILVQRDLKVRYKNSFLGFGWSLINPLLQVIVITFVLKIFLRVGVANYSAYIFCAFLPWSFFQLSLLDASNSLAFQERLLKKVYFPREILPLACVLSNLVHFLLALGVFLVYLAALPLFTWFTGGKFVWTIQPTVFFTPVVIVILFLLSAGLSLVAAALNLFYEDVRFLLTVGLNILYYLVPIIYFPELVARALPHRLYAIYMLNPLSPLISAFRKWVLPPTNISIGGTHAATSGITATDGAYLLVAAVVSVLVAAAGYAFFNARKWQFAERL